MFRPSLKKRFFLGGGVFSCLAETPATQGKRETKASLKG
jgi:hypothetical protein